jgi:hypothetical protein
VSESPRSAKLDEPRGPAAARHTPQDGDSTMSAFRKTVCNVTRSQFQAEAKPVEVVINGQPVVAEVKEFQTGSFGWHHGDKVTLKVGDTYVKVQVGLTLTVIGSKDVPQDSPAKSAA